MISLVIFDCDGVLFDSAAANVAYYNAVLARLGHPPMSDDWARRAHFLSSRQLYEAMFGAATELGAEALRVSRTIDYGPFYELMQPMPELESTLELLAQHYALAMATNRGGTLRGVVSQFKLDRYITCFVGSHDVPRAKPHPDVLEHCLERLRVPPAAAVYVGDSETDHQAAVAAGVTFIGFGPAAPAVHRIHGLPELPPLLDRLRS
ncbi:MAG: HAD family hydrolase [Candidatus Binatia bacterium]